MRTTASPTKEDIKMSSGEGSKKDSIASPTVALGQELSIGNAASDPITSRSEISKSDSPVMPPGEERKSLGSTAATSSLLSRTKRHKNKAKAGNFAGCMLKSVMEDEEFSVLIGKLNKTAKEKAFLKSISIVIGNAAKVMTRSDSEKDHRPKKNVNY